MILHLVGLGFGAELPAELPELAREFPLYWRTRRHPAAGAWAAGEDLEAEIRTGGFAAVAERLCREPGAVLAVPGDPLGTEAGLRYLRQRAQEHGECRIWPGESLGQYAGRLLELDPTRPLAVWDLRSEGDPAAADLYLLGLDDPALAARARDWLRTDRPEARPIWVGPEGLRELEPADWEALSPAGALYVPLSGASPAGAMDELWRIMARLRGPDGCPWDREQDHRSLVPYLIEEAYEVVEALEAGSAHKLQEELGDLLLQVVFHSRLAEEERLFGLQEVTAGLNRKLRFRHPWVFGEAAVSDSNQALTAWESLKSQEHAPGERPSVLDGVPPGLPALQAAWKLGKKAAGVGFDWAGPGETLAKVEEELAEVKAALAGEGPERLAEETGDLLLAVANFARLAGVEPEGALRGALGRFGQRFRFLEERVGTSGRPWEQWTLAELDDLWQEAKREKEGRKKRNVLEFGE